MTKILSELLNCLPRFEHILDNNFLSSKVTGITADSRKVKNGYLFFAITGKNHDGHNYIKKALENGAIAVIAEKKTDEINNERIIYVSKVQEAIWQIGPFFYDYPSQKMRLIAVTGTNGKTTTTYLLKNIFEKAGYKTGVIGTIKALSGERVIDIKNTTPDVLDLQEILWQMVIDCVEYVFMEVSSHALALNRIAGCEFDGAIFTNLTRDHLDFHDNMENYFETKKILFNMVAALENKKNNKWLVANIDDDYGLKILDVKEHQSIKKQTFAVKKQTADWCAIDSVLMLDRAEFFLQNKIQRQLVKMQLTGFFNIYNVLGAIVASTLEGINIEKILESIREFEAVDGRFEMIREGQSYAVIVDYAHTPDGLENVLKTAKAITQGKLIVVFGCGGDRDKTKRAIMGEVAAKIADVVIVTSDNPRSEEPKSILDEIETGVKKALMEGEKTIYFKIEDRKEAIKHAIKKAKEDDVVIIAGKGHETYQILKDRTIDFDDRMIAKKIIKEILGR